MWDGKPIFEYREPSLRNTDTPSAFAAGTNSLNNSSLLFTSLHFLCNVIWSVLQVHDEIAQLAADLYECGTAAKEILKLKSTRAHRDLACQIYEMPCG